MPKPPGKPRPNSRPYTPQRLLSLAVHHEVRRKTQALSAFKDAEDQRPPPEPQLPADAQAQRHEPAAYARRLAMPHEQSWGGISPFAKDYARIVHSSAFRRLQGKTQLIPAGENEVFRTRLTHSLEVADIASRIASTLNHGSGAALGGYRINNDIVACASLLHDLGHPPFGHSGEEVLNERMRDYGGFEGNAQTLRIVTSLESRLGLIEDRAAAEFAIAQAEERPRGMNLTAGTLAAVLKYPYQLGATGRKAGRGAVAGKGIYEEEMPVLHALQALGLGLSPQRRTLECQIMDIADDIAYSAYDLEDTLEAGIVTPLDLVAPDDDLLEAIRSEEGVRACLGPLAGDMHRANTRIVDALTQVFASLFDLGDAYPQIQTDSVEGNRARHIFVARTYLESVMHARHPMVRRQFLEALIERHIAAITLVADADAPHFSRVSVEPGSRLRIECLKAFNYHRVINSRRLKMYHYRSRKILGELFDTLFDNAMERDPKIRGLLLPDRMHEQFRAQGRSQRREAARLVADHLSSLTDSEALRLHAQLTSGQSATFNTYWR
ncbi:dGTP triphosphohydrolase [Roseateles asaccharophilus]|uniref:DGTPase n=1 Tax=Roseateles asaccharophilus TaxID=582607 RepID=A0ABU2A5L9_9BURK|nr:dNTP triphosphohydrolase [Roseateles asaccharophilus]MDR7332494.1 dGTPase [Roseateles asaccharophilus]